MPEPFQKGNSREYVENYERIFKKEEKDDAAPTRSRLVELRRERDRTHHGHEKGPLRP